MTNNSSLKKAARALQRANPGIPFPVAMAAVDRTRPPAPARMWSHGQQPWIRTLDPETATRCYLCGNTTSIVSFGDLAVDQGRVQMYCEHWQCDARETEIVIVDDGTTATAQRSDVRILAHFPAVTKRPRWWDDDPRRVWAAGTAPHVRSSRQRMPCLFCGALSCVLAASDVSADVGRVHLSCTNQTCTANEVAVLPMRDGSIHTRRRADVEAIYALKPPRRHRGTIVGSLEIVPVVDPDPPSDATVLQWRLTGPVPWE